VAISVRMLLRPSRSPMAMKYLQGPVLEQQARELCPLQTNRRWSLGTSPIQYLAAKIPKYNTTYIIALNNPKKKRELAHWYSNYFTSHTIQTPESNDDKNENGEFDGFTNFNGADVVSKVDCLYNRI